MPATYSHFELTDGDISIVFMSNTGATLVYRLSWGGWAPNIATMRLTELGMPYNSVWEELTIDIVADTPALVLAALQDLNTLLDRAMRWWKKRANIPPVLMKYRMKGSNLAGYQQDVVIGYDNTHALANPNDLVALADFGPYAIKGIKLRFLRKNGLLLVPAANESLGATSNPQPQQFTASFSSFFTILAPVAVNLTPNATALGTSASGIIVFANNTQYLAIVEGAPSGTGMSLIFTGAGLSSVVDTTNVATNGRVGRVTATTSLGSITTSGNPGGNDTEFVALYLNIKNGSTTVDCILQGFLNTVSSAQYVAPEVTLKALNPSVPQVVFVALWAIDPQDLPAYITVTYKSVSGSVTLDIDYGAIVWIDKSTSIISIDPTNPVDGFSFNHQLLTSQNARAGCVSTNRRISVTGSPIILHGDKSNDLAVLIMLTQSNYWVVVNAAGTAAVTWTLSGARTPAYLTPA